MSVLPTSSSKNSAATPEYSDAQAFEMNDSLTLIANGEQEDTQQQQRDQSGKKEGGVLGGVAKHTLGLILLLCVVFLWTLSNFLGSVGSPVVCDGRRKS